MRQPNHAMLLDEMTGTASTRIWKHRRSTAAILALCSVAVLSVVGEHAGSAQTPAQASGETVYNDYCAVCHLPSGEGNEELYPPLVDSEWVTGDKGRLIRIVLHGVSGPISVAGTEYDGMMPPWGGILQDAEVAAVATYVRSAWGNSGTPVTPEDVALVRARDAGRTTPWTASELTVSTAIEK